MNLSISNIAWQNEDNEKVYELMKKYDFCGLEIAPTKIFPQNPYDDLASAQQWAENLKTAYGFSVPSMQSVWFGRTEKIFGSEKERNFLIGYTKKAIDFASAIGCKNIVFGCPKNRNMNNESDFNIAVKFFKELGDYAYSKNTAIGMEANPPIYNTNFINDTRSAIELIKKVNSNGFLLTLDVGTMVFNNETVGEFADNIGLINHVHISEPYLALIEKRDLHKELISMLKSKNYDKYVSIEIKTQDDIGLIENIIQYVRGLV